MLSLTLLVFKRRINRARSADLPTMYCVYTQVIRCFRVQNNKKKKTQPFGWRIGMGWNSPIPDLLAFGWERRDCNQPSKGLCFGLVGIRGGLKGIQRCSVNAFYKGIGEDATDFDIIGFNQSQSLPISFNTTRATPTDIISMLSRLFLHFQSKN